MPAKRGRPKKSAATEPQPQAVLHTINTEPPQTIEKIVLVDKAKLNRRGTELNPTPSSVFDQANKLVQTEKVNYEQASMGLRDTIIRSYKNYVGVYDQPYDDYTKRKKIFSPLTHNIIDSVAKPVNVEFSSIRIVPKTRESRGSAKVLNMILPYFFQEMGFNELMRQFTHRVTWLGSQVTVQDWLYEETEEADDMEPTTTIKQGFAEQQKPKQKTMKVISDKPRIRLVNLLDIYTTPTAESLNWAVRNASVIIRSVVALTDVLGNPAFNDQVKANLTGTTYESTSFYDGARLNMYALAGFRFGETKSTHGNQQPRNANPMVTLYERYGMIPKSWITGNEDDALKNVPGIITCAANETSGNVFQTLSVRLSPFGAYGPFEEAHFNKLPNRWYGEGLGERLIPLQAWHNEIINNRRNNEVLVQHRQFVYRKGKVDTRQFFARPGGGIAVENMDDVIPLQMPDIAQSSFVEDQSIEGSAQRLAGAAMTPIQKKATATEIQNIQANANLTFSELKETMQNYLERLVINHLVPLLRKYFKQNVIVPITLSETDMQELDTFNGYAPFISADLKKERFLLIDDDSIFEGDFSVSVKIEDVATTRSAQMAALTNAIGMASKIQDAGLNIKMAIRKMNELSGLYDERLYEDVIPAAPTGVTNPGKPALPQEQMMAGTGAPPPMMQTAPAGM